MLLLGKVCRIKETGGFKYAVAFIYNTHADAVCILAFADHCGALHSCLHHLACCLHGNLFSICSGGPCHGQHQGPHYGCDGDDPHCHQRVHMACARFVGRGEPKALSRQMPPCMRLSNDHTAQALPGNITMTDVRRWKDISGMPKEMYCSAMYHPLTYGLFPLLNDKDSKSQFDTPWDAH